MATKVIIKGSNFGSNANNIKVYYNDKAAAVVNSNGSEMYVITPRQPGDTCNIAVVIGKDSLIFDNQFHYKTTISVTTVAGKPGSADLSAGGTLAEAVFNTVCFLCVDVENNIFMTQRSPGAVVLINEKSNRTMLLREGNVPNLPCVDSEGRVVMVPDDGGDNFFVFDPDNQWATRNTFIIHPTADDIAAGMFNFNVNWKHALASCKLDGYIYTRAYNGELIKFHPKTRKGQKIDEGLMIDGDSYLQFHPIDEHILYLTYPNKHCIYTYNIETKEHKLFAGKVSGAGSWLDGDRSEAEFNNPRQLCMDKEGNVYVADENNHVIRMINTEGSVSTIIGIPGKSGYQDGNPEDALFNFPRGVAIDSNGDIYVADKGNKCVRKLSIQ